MLGIEDELPATQADPAGLIVGRKGAGDFAVGLDLAGHNIARATTIDFAMTDHALISGASSDVLRNAGGGTQGGMILAGSTEGGRIGPIRFRPYVMSSADSATIDPASGDFATKGKVRAASGFQLPVVTVGHLPPCNGAAMGTIFFVTDAREVTYRGPASGGGRAGANVTCDGGNWLYM